MTAIWKEDATAEQTYPALQEDIKVDDVIIGAGITGLTTALKLLEAGRRVAVVEAAKVADSSTGNSTGNLYSTLSSGLAEVEKKWDKESIRQVVSMRTEALTFIEKIAARFSPDCEFKRVPLHWCVTDNSELTQQLQAECDISSLSGLSAELSREDSDLPVPSYLTLRIENQAQFNPFRFTQDLAHAVHELGGLIFEDSAVTDIEPDNRLVKTANGKIYATNIVQATHTPKGINILQAEMEVFREYGIAAAVEGNDYRDGIYWILSDSQSVRPYTLGGKRFVIVVGGKHKTGKGEKGVTYYDQVQHYAKEHFGSSKISHKWSAQQYKSADLLPYIGRSGHDNVFVATGFGADGLVWGAVAADIISHQIIGQDHSGASLLNPRRFTPSKSLENWVKENGAVTKELFKSFLTPAKRAELSSIQPGQGKVVSVDGKKLAIYHSPEKGLMAVSSVCPHMKCRVAWNGEDTSWDCPCHGSRFSVEGDIIEGPACEPLAVHVLEDTDR